MAILSFNGRTNIAVRIVTERYPEADLYEANGTASSGPTTDPAKIDQLRVVFGNQDGSTVFIKETAYGEFGEPQRIPELWVGDVVIKWPIEMDLPEAIRLKEEAGFKGPFGSVTLRNPLVPPIGNPYFIFSTDSSGFVFVDTVTGEVSAG